MVKEFEEIFKSADLVSLQDLAALRVAVSVCESEDMQCMIGRFRKGIGDSAAELLDDQWKRLQSKARRMLVQIGVPEQIIDIILGKLWLISFQIFKWIFYHIEDICIECSSHFCWTPQFKIDYEKTARILTKNEALDKKERFKLACLYCLESEARSLWDKMSLSERRSFFARGNLKKSNQNPIVLYWTYYIQEVPIDHWNSKVLNHSKLFRNAVENGFLIPTKFFFGKLKKQFRGRMIENSFFSYLSKPGKPESVLRDHLDIACFLINELRANYPGIRYFSMIHYIFLYFLEWPLQKHFMVVVNRLSSYLNERNSAEVLDAILEKDIKGFKDYDYKNLFMEFWCQNPLLYKTHVNSKTSFGFMIFIKFVKRHFGFVFEESYFAVKAKFRAVVLQEQFEENVTYFKKDNVEFFKFLVRERVVTRSFIDKLLRYGFMTFIFQRFGLPFLREPFNELMHLIDSITGTV